GLRMKVPPLPRQTGGPFFETYTRGLTKIDLERLFTRDTLEAYKFFSRNIDFGELKKQRWHWRMLGHARLLFLAFTLKLTPARRLIYAIALLSSLIGLMELFREVHFLLIPHPAFAPGTLWLLAGFLLVNLLVLLEVADRLSLKNDLEIAREIQQSMLPRAAFKAPGIEAFGMTRPANTVGGDFYDIVPLPDGRVLLALGDVAGKGSPAALLMALLLAMMRTLIDEGLEGADLVTRLNVQIGRHALPHSRFVTLFLSVLNPATGELSYVNAGQNPPLLRRGNGSYERLRAGGMALGMFENATYTTGATVLEPGDVLVMYSDGITEAEDTFDQPFDEAGVQTVVDGQGWASAKELGWALFEAVETHSRERRLLDDLTVLALRRLPPLPIQTVAAV
ncbi:MAG TPA: PP2C family protein-serine/threonine phosphatase, partial [Vicinamibacterales bacterium]|nr:PP2C family protein-serine/threonine phosphatase [Vicinamibacterales bacterium]